MPSTYTKLLYHIVFSTKRREASILPELRDELYGYMGGVIRDEGGMAHTIGGMPDHVYLLIRWRTDATLADLMRRVKANSSGWIHRTKPNLRAFAWQEGYGAFTVSESQFEAVQHYVSSQEEHHRKMTFQEEFVRMLRAHRVEFDPEMLWK